MDQKKTLWIIAAVGAFLLVVLGAAWIIYTPKTYEPNTAVTRVQTPAAGYSTGTENNSSQMTVPPVSGFVSESGTAKVSEMVVLADNATVYGNVKNDGTTTIDLNSLKQDMLAESAASAAPQNINITVNVDPAKPKTEVSVPVKKEEPVAAKTVKVASEPAKTAASKPSAAKSAPAKTQTVSKAAETKKITQYWVQVAAYSNKKTAENSRSILDANKIPSDIFTFKDSKGTLFYRVRVGPYTTKSEAEYWRTRIIKIDEFAKAESYVTSTTN